MENKKLVMWISALSLIPSGIGLYMLYVIGGWQLATAVFLISFGNNLDNRAKQIEKDGK